MIETGYPQRQGLYDPANERDACGFGFVVDIKGRASHDIVEKALTVLVNLEHRGAVGAEKNTGDGAGILLQKPHAFLEAEAVKLGVKLPKPTHYAAGMVFLPPNEAGRAACVEIFEQVVRDEGQTVLDIDQLRLIKYLRSCHHFQIHGSGNHDNLTIPQSSFDDGLNILAKPHLPQLISFVNNYSFDTLSVYFAHAD
jgi:hypothetical protein